MNKINENYMTFAFLIESKYRLLRYFIFIFIGVIITFNQVFIAYQDCSNLLGNRIYLICFSSFLLYLLAMSFNYYYLIPRFLLNGKYITYTFTLSLVVFAIPILTIAQEYWMRSLWNLPHRITSYTNPLILVDNLASFVVLFICFFGLSAIILFRNWITGNEQITQLEYEHLNTEVNKLKGQITPAFLSKTLNNASALVKVNPTKTTDMLMQLGQLLRYQLYDSNRDKVLLKSEINFITEFLSLEKLNNDKFEYEIQQQGDFNNIQVYPLLFISVVQSLIEHTNQLRLTFFIENETLIFQCYSSDNSLEQDEFLTIKKRLELLYPDNHLLKQNKEFIEFQLNVSK